jgi:ABC-2 type transport system permease protein
LDALAALFVLTLRQSARGRRPIVLALLFLLPSVLAVIVRLAPYAPPPAVLEFAFVFNLIPHALVPLTALLYAGGMIQDEVEEQTLTYLLLRPLPRWALYLIKLAATWLTVALLTGVFTTLTFVVLYWDTPELWGDVLPGRALKTAALLALAQAGYCALFGALSLFLPRGRLLVGIAYIIAFEGLLASFDTVARRLTVMYYFRVLVARWLEPENSGEWSLHLDTAPDAGACVLTLVGVTAALAVAGALLMGREFRMKTPEGT